MEYIFEHYLMDGLNIRITDAYSMPLPMALPLTYDTIDHQWSAVMDSSDHFNEYQQMIHRLLVEYNSDLLDRERERDIDNGLSIIYTLLIAVIGIPCVYT